MRRGLDRRSRWDQTELLQLVELVEVDASLGDLSVLDAEKLDENPKSEIFNVMIPVSSFSKTRMFAPLMSP